MTRSTIGFVIWLVAAIAGSGGLAPAQNITVKAVDEISGAGYSSVTTTDGSGSLPPSIKLPAGATSITFAIAGR